MNSKLEDNILNANRKIKLKYNLSKTRYSSEIVEFIDKMSIQQDKHDLKSKLELLIKKIKKWNSIY